jgi:hypothetical protein
MEAASKASGPAAARSTAAAPKCFLSPDQRQQIGAIKGNEACFDCGEEDPEWASVSFGVVLCFRCAGRHRGYGVHVSFVRSLGLDAWRQQEIRAMLLGGNSACRSFLASESGLDAVASTGSSGHELFYKSPAGTLYRQRLVAQRESEGGDDALPNQDEKEKEKRPPRGPGQVGQAEILRCPVPVPPPASGPALSSLSSVTLTSERGPLWAADSVACMLCGEAFSMLFRRHHCRRCGRCVCGNCAPRRDARPIPEWNLLAPVRHCKECSSAGTLACQTSRAPL